MRKNVYKLDIKEEAEPERVLKQILHDLKKIKKENLTTNESCEKLKNISKKYLTPKSSKNINENSRNSTKLGECFSKNSSRFFNNSSKSLSPESKKSERDFKNNVSLRKKNFGYNKNPSNNDIKEDKEQSKYSSGEAENLLRRKLLRISDASTKESNKKIEKTNFLNFEKIDPKSELNCFTGHAEVENDSFMKKYENFQNKNLEKKMSYENIIKKAIQSKFLVDNLNAKNFILGKIKERDMTRDYNSSPISPKNNFKNEIRENFFKKKFLIRNDEKLKEDKKNWNKKFIKKNFSIERLRNKNSSVRNSLNKRNNAETGVSLENLNTSSHSSKSSSAKNKSFQYLKSPSKRKKLKKILLKNRQEVEISTSRTSYTTSNPQNKEFNDFMTSKSKIQNPSKSALFTHLKKISPPKHSVMIQTNISSEFINSVLKQNDNLILDNRDLIEVNQNQFTSIQGLKEEIRKLVTLKQYYPESEELILEEKEYSCDTSSSFKFDDDDDEIKDVKEDFDPLRGSNFVLDFKKGSNNNCVGVITGSNFCDNDIQFLLDDFKNFENFLIGMKKEVDKDEILKFLNFTFTNFSSKIQNFVEKMKSLDNENFSLKEKIEEIELRNKSLEEKVEGGLKAIEEIQKNSKIEQFDLLKEQKSLFKENKNLIRKVEILERKLKRKSIITNSPITGAITPQIALTDQNDTKSIVNTVITLFISNSIFRVAMMKKLTEKKK